MARRLIQDGAPSSAPPSAPAASAKREQPKGVEIPHDPVNEQILLLAARGDREVRERLVTRVRPDAFLVREHIDQWIVMGELVRRRLDYSPETVRQLSGGKVDPSYLEGLALDRGDYVPPNLDHHVSMLEWDKCRVDTVVGPITQLLDALKDPVSDPLHVRTLAQTVATSLQRGATSSLLRDGAAVARSAVVELRARRQRACYPYGIDGFDEDTETGQWRMIPGCAPGKVTVVTAVPGSGKSAFAARCALAQVRAGRRVLFGAWEPGDEDTLMLLAAMELGWSRYMLSTGIGIGPEQEALLEETMERLAMSVRFMGVPGMAPAASHRARGERASNERALDQIHAMILDVGADVAFFDLWKRCLRLIDPEEEEQALVRQQSILAQTKCHGILLQQQRLKDIEGRSDKRPTREGIKGSGAWVEVADTILGVHRPALWKPVDDVVLEIDVLKQRWGKWPQAVEFDWSPEQASITGGRTIPYDQPGGSAAETALPGIDDFFAGESKGKGKKRPWKGKAS